MGGLLQWIANILGMDVKDTPPVVIAASALFVSACALVTSLYQARQTRRHNRLSARPHLTFFYDADPEKLIFRMLLRNDGLGPARIKEFRTYVDGKRLDTTRIGEWQDTLNDVFTPRPWVQIVGGTDLNVEDAVIRHGDGIELIIGKHPAGFKMLGDHRGDMDSVFARIRFEVEYASFYEERYYKKSY